MAAARELNIGIMRISGGFAWRDGLTGAIIESKGTLADEDGLVRACVALTSYLNIKNDGGRNPGR